MVSKEGEQLLKKFTQKIAREPALPSADTRSIHAGGWGSWDSKYDDFMGVLLLVNEIAPKESPKKFSEFLEDYIYNKSLDEAVVQVRGVPNMDGAGGEDWAKVKRLQIGLTKQFIRELSEEEKEELKELFQKFKQIVRKRTRR